MVLWGCPPPRGYLSVSSVPPEEHGIEGPVPRPPGGPLVGPAQPSLHLPHQGEGLFPQRVRDRAPVPVPWPALLRPPCRPPSLPLRLRRRCRAEAVSRPAGVAAAAPRAPSSLSFAVVAAADEAPVAAVATPRTPSSFSSAAHSWRQTTSAPSRISGAATPLTSPSGGKLCGEP